MVFDFSGKVALVAGAARGIGNQIALDLLASGAQVLAADLAEQPPNLRDLACCTFYQGDISDRGAATECVGLAGSAFGGIDVVANTIGVLWFDHDKSILEINEETWDRVFAINLKPMVWLTRLCVPEMRKRGGGAFVHFSSVDATGGDAVPQDAYGATKAAMIRMSKSVAVQFAHENIRCNTILPGSAFTPMQERWKQNPASLEALQASIPMGRVGTARDMSSAALFLLSDQASYITGTELVVDGGSTAGV